MLYMVNPAEWILNLIFENIFIVVIGGLVLYVILDWIRIRRKETLKPLNRSDVERAKFMERMKHNTTTYFNKLKRGVNTIGKITHLREVLITTNPSLEKLELKPNVPNPIKERKIQEFKKKHKETAHLVQLMVKPYLIERFGFTNPFAKTQIFQLNKEQLDRVYYHFLIDIIKAKFDLKEVDE